VAIQQMGGNEAFRLENFTEDPLEVAYNEVEIVKPPPAAFVAPAVKQEYFEEPPVVAEALAEAKIQAKSKVEAMHSDILRFDQDVQQEEKEGEDWIHQRRDLISQLRAELRQYEEAHRPR
jgi:hypothetical protein